MKVDFLRTNSEQAARRTTVTVAAVFTVLVGLISAIGAGASYRSSTRGTNLFLELGQLPVIAEMRQLVLGKDTQASASTETPDGIMRVMLFGIGGEGHDGPELTDTIILLTVDTKNNRIATLSIPRDTAYPLGGGRFEKINSVQAYAERDRPGEGAQIAAKDIGNLLGVRIDHVVKVDFKGFETFINALGGIDVVVERSFVDRQFPTADDRIQTVRFDKGPQHLNGAQALTYARSRHGSNGEDSDFARDRRQQIVIRAVEQRLLSLGVVTNPTRIANLWSAISNHVSTDLSVWDLVRLAPLIANMSNESRASHVLTDDPNGELVATGGDMGYMLFPKKPDWSDIRAIAQNPFQTAADAAKETRPTTTVRVQIKNGTMRTGFAAQVAQSLKNNGYTITTTGNAQQRGYDRSVIFDLSNGTKPTELARLKKLLNATISSVTPTVTGTGTSTQRVVYTDDMLAEPINATASDFLIILGEASFGTIGQ